MMIIDKWGDYMLRLQILRKQLNISQSELANKMQLSQQSISKYEQGSREPDISTLKQLAKFFNVSIDYLVGYDNPNYFDSSTLSDEEKELLEYYNELSLKDRRWIMGQMIDLIKKASEQHTSDIPKAQWL